MVSGRKPAGRMLRGMATLGLTMLLIACGNGSQKPRQDQSGSIPGQTATPVAGTNQTAPSAQLSGAGQPPQQVVKVGNRPVPRPTPDVGFGQADVVFLPLNDDSGECFYVTWELRYYVRAAIKSLLTPYVEFTAADEVVADQKIWALKSESWVPFKPSEVLQMGRTFNARFAVLPVIHKADNGGIVATVSIFDIGSGQRTDTPAVQSAENIRSPQEAQRILLEASLAATEILGAKLGKEIKVPRAGTAPPPGSDDLLNDAASLCFRWDLKPTLSALEMASVAIRKGPADGRAWAAAARCYARLALDTDPHPARFHRECCLRATLAADLARKYAPEDADVRYAVGLARFAARRYLEAEAILKQLPKEHPGRKAADAMILAVRHQTVEFKKAGLDLSTLPEVTPHLYLAIYANMNEAPLEFSYEALEKLAWAHPGNISIEARRTQAAHYDLFRQMPCASQLSLLAFSRAFADLVPAVRRVGLDGRELAVATLADLKTIAGQSVPDEVRDKTAIAALEAEMSKVEKLGTNEVVLHAIASMHADNILLRLMNAYARFESTALRQLCEAPQPAKLPLELSLADRIRLYDRFVIEGLWAIAESLTGQAKYAEAKSFCTQFAEAFPADEAAQIGASWVYRTGRGFRPESVTPCFDQAKYAWCDYVPEHYTRCEWAAGTRPDDQVAMSVKQVVVRDLFDPSLLTRTAYLLYNNRHWDLAAEQFQKAIDADPYRPKLRVAQIYVERARTEKQFTKEAIERLASEFPDYPDLDETLASLYFDAGMEVEAEKACRKLLESQPGHPMATVSLARVLSFQGRSEEANALIAEQLKSNPRLQYEIGQKALNPLYPRYYRFEVQADQACAAALQGDWDRTLAAADAILTQRVQDLPGAYLKSMYFLHKGDFAEGDKYVFMARVMLQHAPAPYQVLAQWRYYAGMFEKAVESCNNGHPYMDGEIDTHLALTEVRARLMNKDRSGAASVVRRLKLFAPWSTRTYLCDALLSLDLGEIAAARRAIDVVLRHHPSSPLALTVHARILAAEKKRDEATQAFQSAQIAARNPWDQTEAWLYLGENLEAAGKPEEAKAVWETLLNCWPKGWWADQARQGISRIAKD